MLGAAALCGLAAMRSGAGLTTIGVPKSLNSVLQSKISNVIMTLPLKEVSGQIAFGAYAQIKDLFSKFQAVAIGPGLGQAASTKKFIMKTVVECPLPMVVDADALNVVAGDKDVLRKARGPRILTPHPGEMARLTGLSIKEIESNRLKVARDFAVDNACVLLLKGHRTIVAAPNGKTYVNKTGNSGMATAGCGDVLTGMLTAFLGQGIEPFEAARTACYLHGMAGDKALMKQGKVSLIATDLINSIAQIK